MKSQQGLDCLETTPPTSCEPNRIMTKFLGLSLALRVLEAAIVSVVLFFIYRTGWFHEEHGNDTDGFQTVVPFNAHFLCMIVSFPVLMTEAVVAYVTWEGVFRTSHKKAKNIHMLLNAFSFVFLFAGLVIIFLNHEADFPGWRKASHPLLYSAHSMMGVLTTVLMLSTITSGLIVYTGGRKLKLSDHAKQRFMPTKRALGFSTYACGMATCLMGIMEKQGFLPKDDFYSEERMLLGSLSLLIGLLGTTVALYINNVKHETLGPSNKLYEQVYLFDENQQQGEINYS